MITRKLKLSRTLKSLYSVWRRYRMLSKGKSNYDRRMQEEIEHYQKVHGGRMCQDVPEVWHRVERHFADRMEKITGVRNLYEYVGRYHKNKKKVSVLGLGSGPCGNELDGIAPILTQNGCEMELVCIDINEAVLRQAEREAAKRDIPFTAIIGDANRLSLEANTFDVIVAYAALHHFVELDHITKEINKALTNDGVFVTVDIPTRNGYRMWDETYEVVNHIWKVLPPRFKIDHTGYAEPKYVETYENVDYSSSSFECINSEAIVPSLRRNLNEISFVPALSMARRLFDTKFGPNYNLDLPLDKSIFDVVIALDSHYIDSDILKPETFFGAYVKK